MAETSPQGAAGGQETGQHDRVAIHHPLLTGQVGGQAGADRRQSHIDHGHIELHEEHPRAHHHQQHPPSPRCCKFRRNLRP